jgi:predicted Zn-dependent protease
LLACAVNPVTGKRELSLMSEGQEVTLGRDSDPQIVAQYGLYDDDKVAAYVDEIGQRMAKLSHRPQLQFTFRVLDSPVINAFALPGGYVYITRGILAHMNNEAELAVVLGHEIGHVTARHGARQYSKQQLAGLGLGLGSVFIPQVAQFGQLAETALGLLFLKYGRDDEHEADRLGVQYSLAAGFDPETGAKFFEVLDRQQQESGQSLPGWMSTHPAPADRVGKTGTLARELKAATPGNYNVGEAAHKDRIDNIVFGDNPRHGFVDGNTFKHPDLAFAVTFPAGWQIMNLPSAVLAGDKEQTAQLQMTLEPSEGAAPAAFATNLVAKAGASVAAGGNEKIGGFSAYLAEVVARDASSGQTQSVQIGCIQQKDKGPIFLFVGIASNFRSSQPQLVQTIRSFKTLTGKADLEVQPNRLQVEAVPAGKTLAAAVSAYPDVPVPVGTIALLNNLQPETALSQGFRLKVVRGGFKPS